MCGSNAGGYATVILAATFLISLVSHRYSVVFIVANIVPRLDTVLSIMYTKASFLAAP